MDPQDWWERYEARHFVEDALGALDSGASRSDPIERCERYFDAVNLLVNGLRATGEAPKAGEEAGVKALLSDLSLEHRQKISLDDSLIQLRRFEPLILSQRILNDLGYDPFSELTPEMIKAASEVHRKFNRAVDRFASSPATEDRDRLVRMVASIFFLVRNNLKHGEKTPYGPDRAKVARDRNVCAIVAPIVDAAMAAIFSERDKSLATYGTIGTTAASRHLLDSIGDGIPGFAPGTIAYEHGVPVMALGSWRHVHLTVRVELFSDDRIARMWPRFDAFQGHLYRRRSALIKLANDRYRVAQIYVGSH